MAVVETSGGPERAASSDAPREPRRNFLVRLWKTWAALVAAAGVWTSWDILRPRTSQGFGGKLRTIAASRVPETDVVEVRSAQTWLTQVDGEILALWWRCPHLGCRVPWCDSSGQFECPCHGSHFNRAGEHRAGPAPRGMDRFPVEVVDGTVVVDTGTVIDGPPLGTETLDEPVKGPSCVGGE